MARLRRRGARVIGVTGSFGKTTAKEAIAHVLGGCYRVLKSEKSYNTEIGVPLTILELESGFSSLVAWIRILSLALIRALAAMCGITRARYDVVILEMGVDKPGDMDVLLSVVRPDIGVFTGVAPVHLADGQFADLDAIYREKVKLVAALPRADGGSDARAPFGGVAFLCGDDVRARAAARETTAKSILYGSGDGVQLRVRDVVSAWGSISFSVTYGKEHGSFTVPIMGSLHAQSLLPAIGCGLLFGMHMDEITGRLATFRMPPGRFTLIDGARGSYIFDSSYNASPRAVASVLEMWGEVISTASSGTSTRASGVSIARRIFVLGTMNELGTTSEQAHRDVARLLKGRVDLLVTVGDGARWCADEARALAVLPPDAIMDFADAGTAAEFLATFVRAGDVILVKGSQNRVRLERLVKRLMARPQDASVLLARQDWTC